MAEFVGDAEETMRRLDLLGSQTQESGVKGNQTQPESVGPQHPKHTFEMSNNPLLQTRFYHCAGVFGYGGEFFEPTDTRFKEHPSHYTSISDPRYLIRALYEWKEPATSSRRELGADDCPDASDINLIGFTVTSRPISSFFEKRLGLDLGVGIGILKLGMPFKPIIRNRQILKSHLEELEKKYALVEENTKTPESPDPHSDDSQGLPDEDGSNGSLSSDDTKDWEFCDHEPALEHFRLLFQFIDDYLGEKMDLFEKLQAGHEETVSYEDLWMLFTNGKKVICPLRENQMSIGNDSDSEYSGSESEDDDSHHVTRRRYAPQSYQVMATIGGSPLKSSLAPQDLDVTSNELKDEYLFQMLFGRRTDTEIFVFKPFDGQIQVKSLEAYPMNYFVSPRMNYLSQRGRKFIDVAASSRHMDHTGMTIGETREDCNSPVVIDLRLAFTESQKEFPESDDICPKSRSLTATWPAPEVTLPGLVYTGPPFCKHGQYCHGELCAEDMYDANQKEQLNKIQPRIQELLEGFSPSQMEQEDVNRFKEYMESQELLDLLPGTVPGFSLLQFNLDQLDYIYQQDDWNSLALPKGHRDIVQAMVETHSMGLRGKDLDDETLRLEMDLVKGKGDVGYEPEDVERNMGKHFKLANRWGCVLLLDEADVFLAKRNKTDVKRNGLVSSFLRILEYYSGILFLTTNRVGAIDDAFRSRLHLTLYYPKLTERQTLKIWKTNLQRLKSNNKIRVDSKRVPIEFNDRKIMRWVKDNWEEIEWNGRQIRNAFQTAVALAEFKAKKENASRADGSSRIPPVLTTDHFKLLARTSTQFSEYLRETHGDDEDERAVLDKIRAGPARRKLKKTTAFDESDDESDILSDSASGSGSSSDLGLGNGSESELESSAVEKKTRKKSKQGDHGGRSRSTRRKQEKKGKRREDK
ncbi:hypothetical protein Daus18300_008419 [Diaporthe australafricana]|uniref:ATPase AAA-type core domain-containing protein n=1 Tax=Diaporthe australafricana TaxID=127596 RepID=A0ABR3WI54_9PEZI